MRDDLPKPRELTVGLVQVTFEHPALEGCETYWCYELRDEGDGEWIQSSVGTSLEAMA